MRCGYCWECVFFPDDEPDHEEHECILGEDHEGDHECFCGEVTGGDE